MTLNTDTGLTPWDLQSQYRDRVKALGWVMAQDGVYYPPSEAQRLGITPVTDPTQQAAIEAKYKAANSVGGTYQQAAPTNKPVATTGGAPATVSKITNPTSGQYDPDTGAIWDGGAGKWVGGRTAPGTSGAPAPTAVTPPAVASPTTATYDPSATAGPIAGMTNIQVTNYRAQANAALKQMGVLDYQPSNGELQQFFQSGFDAEGIANYYMTDPTFVTRNPGAPWGVSRDTYQNRLAGYQQAWQGVFGSGSAAPAAPSPSATKTERDQSLFGIALKGGISDSALSGTLESFRQTRGRAPTGVEFQQFADQQSTGTRTPGARATFGAPQTPQRGTITRPAT